MNEKILRDYIFMLIGSLLIGFGVSFVIAGNVGGDSLTTLEQGLSITFNTTVPIAQIMVNAVFVIILFIFYRSRVSFSTVLSPFVISFGCFLVNLIMEEFQVTNMPLRLLLMIIGLIIIGLGIGFGAQSPAASNPYDALVLSMSEAFKFSYAYLRPICDALILVLGILLKGSFGIGTILATFLQGYIAEFFIKNIKKVVE